MKKVLPILLALALLFSLAACGGQAAKPADTGKQSSDTPAAKPADAGEDSSGTPETKPADGSEASAKAPKELGFYDPDFDYTQYPKYKVAFLSMTAGETWDVYDVAYAHWCEKMNIDYTHIWAPTQYSAEEFLSGMQTFIDQDYDGLILEASNTIPRAADILNKAGVQWVCGLSVPRDDTGTMLHPAIGFDNYDVGVKIVDRLVQRFDHRRTKRQRNVADAKAQQSLFGVGGEVGRYLLRNVEKQIRIFQIGIVFVRL